MTRIGFLVLYLLAMVPTYILPYFGSNSMLGQAIWATGSRSGAGLLFTGLHLGALAACVYLAWARSAINGKRVITAFALIAAAFDIVPVLSVIPLVPTVLHILALVSGFDDKDEIAELADAPRLARHPLLALASLSAMTIVGSVLLAALATTPFLSAVAETASTKEANPRSVEAAASKAPEWTYYEHHDKMRGDRTITAALRSETTVNLGFPYEGEQPLRIYVSRTDYASKAPSYFSVLFSIQNGQLACRRDIECRYALRFDKEAIQNLTGFQLDDEPNGIRSGTDEARALIDRLKAGGELTVELRIHQHGDKQFTFKLPATLELEGRVR